VRVLVMHVVNVLVLMQLLIAGAFMAVGVWLHLTDQHRHQHTHEAREQSWGCVISGRREPARFPLGHFFGAVLAIPLLGETVSLFYRLTTPRWHQPFASIMRNVARP
jgi:hypothetical protein